MKPKGNSIKENIDAMCKSLGFKKDRKVSIRGSTCVDKV